MSWSLSSNSRYGTRGAVRGRERPPQGEALGSRAREGGAASAEGGSGSGPGVSGLGQGAASAEAEEGLGPGVSGLGWGAASAEVREGSGPGVSGRITRTLTGTGLEHRAGAWGSWIMG